MKESLPREDASQRWLDTESQASSYLTSPESKHFAFDYELLGTAAYQKVLHSLHYPSEVLDRQNGRAMDLRNLQGATHQIYSDLNDDAPSLPKGEHEHQPRAIAVQLPEPTLTRSMTGATATTGTTIVASDYDPFVHWFHGKDTDLAFEPSSYESAWPGVALDIRPLVIESGKLSDLSLTRHFLRPCGPPTHEAPTFSRYELNGTAEMGGSFQAVCGSVWVTRALRSLDAPEQRKCKDRSHVIVYFRIPENGLILALRDKVGGRKHLLMAAIF